MKTQSGRATLCKVFGHASWRILRMYIVEATDPYPIVLSWRCIAKGKTKGGNVCIFNERLKEDPNIDASYVAENFTYIRFKASRKIWRYLNPADMTTAIKEFDLTKETTLEAGDKFTLLPMSKARTHAYSRERRAAIAAGKWKVTPRGADLNKRRPVYHARPY